MYNRDKIGLNVHSQLEENKIKQALNLVSCASGGYKMCKLKKALFAGEKMSHKTKEEIWRKVSVDKSPTAVFDKSGCKEFISRLRPLTSDREQTTLCG